MRKNFGAKTWLYPMPVLIVGTYDENGTPFFAMSSAWLPRSTIFPAFTTRIMSARRIVESRWAITNDVRPSITFSIAS